MRRYLLHFAWLLVITNYTCYDANPSLQIERMIAQYISRDLFSGSVLVARGGEIIFHKSYAYLNRENKIPMQRTTKLKIGSIVKDFTACAILQLLNQKKLKLDDPISTYIDMFPPEIQDKVTIRQLLRHESGFGDYLRNPEHLALRDSLRTVNDIIGLFQKEPLLFEPGSTSQYSNSGYTVLGAIIESVSGQSYFSYIEDNILTPLEMSDTDFDWQKIANIDPRPVWYIRSATGKFYSSPFDEWPSPSGGAYATCTDLLIFELSLLNDNRVLSGDMKRIMFARYRPGVDLDLNDLQGTGIKAGGSPGSNAVVISDFDRNYIIIVLANYDEPIAEIIGKNIHAIIQDKPYDPPRYSIFERCYLHLKSHGGTSLKNNFFSILDEEDFNDPPDLVLNRVGYDLLREENFKDAITIFVINTKLFPDIANTWDSLAEAYMLDGNKERAILNYKKSLELNSENLNAKRMLEKLEANM